MRRTSDPAGGPHRYLIALGSNRRHGRWGAPAHVLAAAIGAIAATATVAAQSRVVTSAAIGPSRRRYANAAAIVASDAAPAAMLARLHQIERRFGRRRGQRWGARVLDLDIILWSGGRWGRRGNGAGDPSALVIPHPRWATRRFVADPAAAIAGDWPVAPGAMTVRHWHARLHRDFAPAPALLRQVGR